MKKLWEFVKAMWAWYVLQPWYNFFPPKPKDPRSAVLKKDLGQTLDDE